MNQKKTAMTGMPSGQGGKNSRNEDSFLASYLRAESSSDFLESLPYDASPTTDDRPFFFYTLRLSDLFALIGDLGGVERNNLGVLILLLLLLLSVALTLVFVIGQTLVLMRYMKEPVEENAEDG